MLDIPSAVNLDNYESLNRDRSIVRALWHDEHFRYVTVSDGENYYTLRINVASGDTELLPGTAALRSFRQHIAGIDFRRLGEQPVVKVGLGRRCRIVSWQWAKSQAVAVRSRFG